MKLDIINLNKSYGEKKVLEDVNFTFTEGHIYGLIGRNGAGKTTFFNALNQCVKKNIATNRSAITQVPTFIFLDFPVKSPTAIYVIRPNAMP